MGTQQNLRKPIGLKYRVWYLAEDNRGGEPIDQKLAPIKGVQIHWTFREFRTEFEARMFAASFAKWGADYEYCAMPAHGEGLWSMPNEPIKKGF